MDLSHIEWLPAPPAGEGASEHLNCFQRVLVPCSDLLGTDEAHAKRAGAYFGGGLGHGGLCGPAAAGLLLLGELYGGDPARVDEGKRFLLAFAGVNGSWLCDDIRDEPHVRCERAIRFTLDYIETRKAEQTER